MTPKTDEETPEGGLQSATCSPSLERKYENRGGEIWEWDGQKWRELFSSDAIQRLDYYERKIASMGTDLAAAHKALMVCDGAMIGKVKPSSVAFKMIGAILRPENVQADLPATVDSASGKDVIAG